MGEILTSLLKSMSCENCSKYVCNAMHIESECCDCYRFQYSTDMVEIHDEYDDEIIMDDCCSIKHKK